MKSIYLLVVSFWVAVSCFMVSGDKQVPQDKKSLPALELKVTEEEGKKVVMATVELNGKPLENAKVGFYVKRTFGLLPIGKDQTLDDGTAVANFPDDLPSDKNGKLLIIGKIESPEEYNSVSNEIEVTGGRIIPVKQEEFPRALWSPKVPVSLLATIFILLSIVWICYFYVISRLIKIYGLAKEGGVKNG